MYLDRDANFWSLGVCTSEFYADSAIGMMSVHRVARLKYLGTALVSFSYISDSFYVLDLGGLFGNTWRLRDWLYPYGRIHEIIGSDLHLD